MGSERKQATRAEWQKRVERWRDSGLSAEQFAAELGINAGTLKYWKYMLCKAARSQTPKTSFVEVVPSASQKATVVASAPDTSFVVEVGPTRRLRVPANFDAVALRRLLNVLEGS